MAIKFLAEHLLVDRRFRDMFRAEAGTLARVQAPNVVRLYEYVESDAYAAIVMELCEGVSLRTMLERHGATEPESALCVLKGSLLGLGAAHAAGIVHRDYKPENVLVDGSGESRLTDFGIAACAGTDGAVGGTPLYMSPEQWQEAAPSVESDIYAATAVFIECLTGRPPFEAFDPDALRLQHERAPVPVEHLPAPVQGLARRGLAKDPRKRPANTTELLTELDRVAIAAYGADWEERGREGLAARAALLAALFPGAVVGATGGTALATTRLGGRKAALRRYRAPVVAGAAVAVLIGVATLVIGPAKAWHAVTAIDPVAKVIGSESGKKHPSEPAGPNPNRPQPQPPVSQPVPSEPQPVPKVPPLPPEPSEPQPPVSQPVPSEPQPVPKVPPLPPEPSEPPSGGSSSGGSASGSTSSGGSTSAGSTSGGSAGGTTSSGGTSSGGASSGGPKCAVGETCKAPTSPDPKPKTPDPEQGGASGESKSPGSSGSGQGPSGSETGSASTKKNPKSESGGKQKTPESESGGKQKTPESESGSGEGGGESGSSGSGDDGEKSESGSGEKSGGDGA